MLNNYGAIGCDKDQEVCMHQGTSPGGFLRINADLGLGEMISPLDCIHIIFYDIITSYSLLILSSVATSKSEVTTWHHKQNGVPYSIPPKRASDCWEHNHIEFTGPRIGHRKAHIANLKTRMEVESTVNLSDWVVLFWGCFFGGFFCLFRERTCKSQWGAQDETFRVSGRIFTDCGVKRIVQTNVMKPSGKKWSLRL